MYGQWGQNCALVLRVGTSGVSGLCGLALSSEYKAREKAAYAEACLTPWWDELVAFASCGGSIVARLLTDPGHAPACEVV